MAGIKQNAEKRLESLRQSLGYRTSEFKELLAKLSEQSLDSRTYSVKTQVEKLLAIAVAYEQQSREIQLLLDILNK